MSYQLHLRQRWFNISADRDNARVVRENSASAVSQIPLMQLWKFPKKSAASENTADTLINAGSNNELLKLITPQLLKASK
jgi:hypothetical protein